jgi:prevent-host-death family protein
MEITATEFKKNLGKYLGALAHEDVLITKNGKVVARLIDERAYREGAAELNKLLLLREIPAAELYDSGAGPGVSKSNAFTHSGRSVVTAPSGNADKDEWFVTHNGEAVAQITPMLKKKKRRLGFIKGPGATPEEIEALLESEWTEEIEREWLSKL